MLAGSAVIILSGWHLASNEKKRGRLVADSFGKAVRSTS
jgi:hypothetical protein